MLGKKLMIMIIAGLLLVGVSSVVWADNSNRPPEPPGNNQEGMGRPAPPDATRMKADLEKSLAQLVASKLITEKQKTTILQYFETFFSQVDGMDPRLMVKKYEQLQQEGQDPLSRLKKDKVLNQEQADAVAKLFPPKPPQPPTQGAGPGPHPPTSGLILEPYKNSPPCCLASNDCLRAGRRPWPPSPETTATLELLREHLHILTQAQVITPQQEVQIYRYFQAVSDETPPPEPKRGPHAE